MSQYTAIQKFPEAWGLNARCPLCKCRTMQIMHYESAADQLYCPYCNVSFEVEEKGEHIFFTEAPPELAEKINHQWVSRQQLALVLEKKLDNIEEIKSIQSNSFIAKPAVSKANPVRAEAVRRARKLVELGNSPDVIRISLAESLRLTDFAIEEIITDAVNVYKMKRRAKNKKYFIFFAVAAIVLIISFIVLSLVF